MSSPSAPETRRPRVRSIDFRRPSKFTRDQVRYLERAHEGFCRAITSRLSAELRTDFALTLAGTEQLPYSVVMLEQSPREALVATLALSPGEGQIALILEMPLVHAMLTRLLGGDDVPQRTGEGLTELEIAVAACILSSLVESLSAAWEDLTGVRLAATGTETSPMAVEIVSPSEPVLLVAMHASLAGVPGAITLVIPHRSVAPVLQRVDRHHATMHGGDGGETGAMEAAMGGVDVVLRAEVGAVELPIADVLRLRPGDVIRLDRPAAAGAVLHVDEVPVHTVLPGRNGNARAVQVLGPTVARR